MKLIFSIPGVPSAAPAHENSASIGPPHSSSASVDARLVAQVEVDRLHTGERHRREVHHHDLGAEVLHELGGGRAHSGGAAHDQRPLAVVAECVCLHDACSWFGDLELWCDGS